MANERFLRVVVMMTSEDRASMTLRPSIDTTMTTSTGVVFWHCEV